MLIAVTMPSDCKSICAISFSAPSRERVHEHLNVFQGSSQNSRNKNLMSEKKKKKNSRWNTSHMQRGRPGNGQEKHWGYMVEQTRLSSLANRVVHSHVKLQTVTVKQIPKRSLLRTISSRNVLIYLWCC